MARALEDVAKRCELYTSLGGNSYSNKALKTMSDSNTMFLTNIYKIPPAMFSLAKNLEKFNISVNYSYDDAIDMHQIINIPRNFSVICGKYSYGSDQQLLELKFDDENDVYGYLTGKECFEKIKQHLGFVKYSKDVKCPNCGAARTEKESCPYCDTLFVDFTQDNYPWEDFDYPATSDGCNYAIKTSNWGWLDPLIKPGFLIG